MEQTGTETTTSPQHLFAELMVTREGDYPKHLGFITAGCSTSKRLETNAVHPRIFIFEHPNFSLAASGHVNFQVLDSPWPWAFDQYHSS